MGLLPPGIYMFPTDNFQKTKGIWQIFLWVESGMAGTLWPEGRFS